MNTLRDATGPAPTSLTGPDHGADALVGLLQKEGLIAEAQLRYAIRVGRISRPARLGFNLVWGRNDVVALCTEFGLQVPEVLR